MMKSLLLDYKKIIFFTIKFLLMLSLILTSILIYRYYKNALKNALLKKIKQNVETTKILEDGTIHQLDEQGAKKKATFALNGEIYKFDKHERLYEYISPKGVKTEYDVNTNKMIKNTYSNGLIQKYNPINGLLIQEIEPNGQITEFDFETGQKTEVIYPDGRRDKYNSDGLLIKSIFQDKEAQFEYDPKTQKK